VATRVGNPATGPWTAELENLGSHCNTFMLPDVPELMCCDNEWNLWFQ
jgi:hypothetical protein